MKNFTISNPIIAFLSAAGTSHSLQFNYLSSPLKIKKQKMVALSLPGLLSRVLGVKSVAGVHWIKEESKSEETLKLIQISWNKQTNINNPLRTQIVQKNGIRRKTMWEPNRCQILGVYLRWTQYWLKADNRRMRKCWRAWSSLYTYSLGYRQLYMSWLFIWIELKRD